MSVATTSTPSDVLAGLSKEEMRQKAAALDVELAQVKETVMALRGKPEHMEEYTAAFKKMADVDAQSLVFLLASVREEMSSKVVKAQPLPTTKASKEFRERAVASILGSLVADAASTGVEWEYDMGNVAKLAEARDMDLTFYEPFASPWLKPPAYFNGCLSPYGEQLYTLVKSLAEAQGFDLAHYAQTNYKHFDSPTQAARYRDTLVKNFLRHMAHGKAPPSTGSDDQQAHSPVRSAAIAIGYSGSENFDAALDQSIRVFQNKDGAIGFAFVHAATLTHILNGAADLRAALTSGIAETRAKAASVSSNESLSKAYTEAADAAEEALNDTSSSADYVTKVGRHCGCPAGLKAPYHVILAAAAQHGTADKQKLFVEAVKLGLLQGGDVASRNSVVGAVLGAYGGMDALPKQWVEKCPDFAEWKQLAEKLVAIRA